MPQIRLTLDGEVLKEYELTPAKTLTIGRQKFNDIVIREFSVSRHHAKISSMNGKFLLIDLESRNGTFVNAKPVHFHWLKPGDAVTIGKHNLLFIEAEEGAGDENRRKRSVEPIIMRRAGRTMAEPVKTHAGVAALEIASDAVGVLSFLAGEQGPVRLYKKLTTMGTDPLCDIVVGGLLVGRIALTISRTQNGYYLSCGKGFHKPKVNGYVVSRSLKLEKEDVIELGPNKLKFSLCSSI